MEVTQESLDTMATEPPNDGGRHLVADHEHHDRIVLPHATHLAVDIGPNLATQ